MVLIDRLAHDGSVPHEDQIAAHSSSAALFLWATGKITRTNVVDAFNLTVGDQVQLDQLSSHYTSLSSNEKREFHGRVESVSILLENGLLIKSQAKTLFGMT